MNISLFNINNIYQVFDSLPASIYWKDINGIYLGCNHHMTEIFGMDRKYMLGKTDYEFLAPDSAKRISSVDSKVFLGEEYWDEEYLEFNDKIRTYITRKIPSYDKDGMVNGLLGISIEISSIKERLEADKKAALLEEEIKITQILDMIPANIYWKHKNEYYLGYNKSQKIAWNNDNFIGRNEYDVWPKEEADKIHKTDQYVLDCGSYSGEEIVTDPSDKVTRSYFSSKHRLFDAKGNIIGIAGASIDISDLKNEQKKSEQLLLENLKAHEKIIKQQDEFRSIVAQMVHDLGSPLLTMQMVLSLCENIPEEKRMILSRATARVRDITNHMLTHFKSKQDDSDISVRMVSLISVNIMEVISEKQYEYSNEPITIVTDIAHDSYFTFINIDLRAFKRMLSNLINNAFDACKTRNGTITIHTKLTDKDSIQIIVEDDGLGMPNDVKERILNNIEVTKNKTDGHGIGFSQIRDTLAKNDGKLSIESKPLVGTKIIIDFPKVENPDWICSCIELYPNDLVIILDDDPSIHGAWENRFNQVSTNIRRKHFEQGADTIDFINNLSPEEKNQVFLLTDYELLKQGLHGIDVINATKVERSVVVTSHHANDGVQELVKLAQTKILPKLLASEVLITIAG